MVQAAVDRVETIPTQEVTREAKAMPYRQAQTVMTPAAVEGSVKVEGDVGMADVPRKDLPAAAAERYRHSVPVCVLPLVRMDDGRRVYARMRRAWASQRRMPSMCTTGCVVHGQANAPADNNVYVGRVVWRRSLASRSVVKYTTTMCLGLLALSSLAMTPLPWPPAPRCPTRLVA
jgi:hypothetical protein